MDAKEKLRQIIKEEIQSVLAEQETSKKRRAGIGKGKGGRFTSAGTIPNIQNRKLTPAKIKNREEIGKKMLNTFRRGGAAGKDLRDKIQGQLDNKGLPTSRKHQYSQIWANASSMAANGATASDVGGKKGKSKKPKESNN